ncbi:hypothetical protein [Methylobacterium sp. SI9]|uniref:hypothetical protein n=1 Tax=Methylobacterium guangdongense TaxID=3138811 RepID=UPI00313B9DC6
MLLESPQLTQALQNAQSSQEAHALMADAWKFAGYNRPGGENPARLATTQAYANSFGGGQALPAVAAPRGGSMGAIAQRGGFALGGIVGQGTSVPGQSSPVPGVASLSDQPLTVAPPSTGFPDPAQQPSNPYAQIGKRAEGCGAAEGRRNAGSTGSRRAADLAAAGPGHVRRRQVHSTLRNAGVQGV